MVSIITIILVIWSLFVLGFAWIIWKEIIEKKVVLFPRIIEIEKANTPEGYWALLVFNIIEWLFAVLVLTLIVLAQRLLG